MIKKDRILRILGLGIVLLFALLIFKDPFSQRTLIPNFEPYPDAIYYISPALNLIKGQGFNVNREGRVFNANAPPLYSISFIPMFILKADPRMAYYSNVVLAIISLSFFWLILKKILTNKLVIYSLLILYITNYFIYFVPSIIMAENLILALFLAGLFFLLSEVTAGSSIIIALLSVGIYATKFSSITLSISMILLFLGKIFLSKLVVKRKIKQILSFFLSVALCSAALGIFLAVTSNYDIVSHILSNLSLIGNSVPKGLATKETTSPATWFAIQYVSHNLPSYVNSLIGNSNRFLWDYTPLVPKYAAIGGILGILMGIFNKRFRLLSLSLFLYIVTLIAFQSTFYSFDARYIYIAIPSLIIGFGLFLNVIENVFRRSIITNTIIFIIIVIYLTTSFTRIKSQISLNLKYSETPWYYISVLKLNEYFTNDKIIDGKKPLVISAVPPFLIDYYSNGNYTVLPLSYEQEFRSIKEIVWGPNDYSDLPRLYKKYLDDGYNVYVSRAGLGNESYTNRDFNIIITEFDTKLVLQGCYDQCNIYSVKLKQKNAL